MAGIPINTILGALPDGLKSKGTAKLPELILKEGVKIDTLIQPTLTKIISQLPSDNICLTEEQTQLILDQRNNIVGSLNNIGNVLDKLTITLTGLSTFLELTTITLQTLKTSKFVASLAAKFIPVIPGAVPSALSDLGDVIRNVTFDKEGNSKLKPISNTINAAALSTAVVNSYITLATSQLETIDLYLKTCSQQSLSPLNNTVNGIVNLTNKAESSSNNSSYKGFAFEIEVVPFNDKVNQIRAIAVNKSGIKMIETELSFSTNQQTLINELKFIIDRDNLKA